MFLTHCQNCGYDLKDGMLVYQKKKVCPSCYAKDGKRAEEAPYFGWKGAGYVLYKSEMPIPGWLPPVDDKEAWQAFIGGFRAALIDDLSPEESEALINWKHVDMEDTSSAFFRILKFPLWEKLRRYL